MRPRLVVVASSAAPQPRLALFVTPSYVPAIIRGLSREETMRRSLAAISAARATAADADRVYASLSARIEYCAYHGVCYEGVEALADQVERLVRRLYAEEEQ